MSTHPTPQSASPELGARLVTLAGLGLVGYGVLFLIRNFTGLIELGLTAARVGGTPEQIHSFSPHLFNYISHLQVAVAALLIALGVAVITVEWQRVRTRQRWAVGTALLALVIGIALAVPPHYVYGLATLGHLGPIYLDTAILLIGSGLAWRALGRSQSARVISIVIVT